MKVKNIMFSGVMGVILMSVASNANAAISVASKAYVDTKASSVEAAYKAADTALETAYKEADTALGARVTKNTEDIATNAQEIAAVKVLTGSEGVAEQITAAKTELTTAINKKVDQTEYDTKVGELAGDIAANATAIANEATARESAIAGVDAKFADYTKTSDLNTTYVSETEMTAFKTSNTDAIADAKKAGTDAAAALETYKGTNDVAVADAKKAGTDAAAALETYKGTNDAAVQKNAEDIAANAEAIGALDSTYVSESEMSAFQTTNTAAIAAKVDQTAYDAKVTEIETALDAKIAMPAACETQDCVLAINKASGTISWTPLTEPVADFINQQN